MADKSRGIWSLVVIAALVSLVVSIVRLVGELQGWGGVLFAPGGPGAQQGRFGIAALIPIFGFWFGWRLRRVTGGPRNAGIATLVYLLGIGVLAGGFALARALGLLQLPTEDAPGTPTGMLWAAGAVLAAVIVMLCAWPRLSVMLLVYALLARIPVIVITYLAVANGWDTHYDKLPPHFVVPEGVDKATFLSIPQLTFWIVATMFVGGLCGCLAAALARRKG